MTLGWPSCAYKHIKGLHLPGLEICLFSLVLEASLFRHIVEMFQCPQEASELQILQLKRYLKKTHQPTKESTSVTVFFYQDRKNHNSSQTLNQTL